MAVAVAVAAAAAVVAVAVRVVTPALAGRSLWRSEWCAGSLAINVVEWMGTEPQRERAIPM